MDAQLTIDDETLRTAERLAELTGQSVTAVVAKALRAELEREELQHRVEAEAERMLAMGRDIRGHLHELISSDHSCLYDENGFPK